MPKAKIFIVEDESIVALDIKCCLGNLGYTVCGIAASGEEAIERIKILLPDLVLMDIGLEGKIDGIRVAEEVKASLDIPVIYLTANSDESTLHRAKITEPFGFILKPYEEKTVQTTIEMALYKYNSEKKIRENERWFSTTLKSIGDAVITTDLEGNVTFLNTVAEELTGYGIEEAKGKALEEVFNIINEYSRLKVEHPAGKVIREGVIVGLANHTILISKNGTEIPIDDSASPIKDEKGNITGVVLVFRNISDRKLAERKLRQSEQNSRNLIELFPYGVLVHSKGIALYCNSAAIKMIGASRLEDIVGKPFLNFLHPDSHTTAYERIKYMTETGNSVSLMEEKIVRFDGTVLDVEIAAGPIIYEGKEALQAVIRDITEQKHNREELIKSEEKYRTTFENTGTGTIIAEDDGVISLVNDEFCKIAGYEKEEIEGKMNLREFISKNDWERIYSYHSIRRSSPDEAPHTYEYKFQDRWGNIKIVINSAAMIPGTSKCIVGVHDITERKKAEEAILKSEKQFRLVWENSADGMRLTDQFGNVVMVNEAFCRMAEMDKASIEGKSISLIYHNKVRASILNSFVRRFKSRTIVPHFQQEMELWNGKRLWFEVSNSLLELNGHAPLLLSIFRNITERKASEERLTRLNECLLSFGPDAKENINRLVTLCGEQLNATTALYNRLEDGKLCSLGQWNIPEDFDAVDNPEGHICYEIIRNKSVGVTVIRDLQNTEYQKTDPNVSRYGLRTYIGTAVAFGNANIGTLCVVYQDDYEPSQDEMKLLSIAAAAIGVEEERKRAQDEIIIAKETAEKADKLKTDFLAQMSHEIRTPINTILSFTSLLREELENKIPEDLATSFKIIDNGGRRLTRTIDMILTMSQLQAGNYEFNAKKIKLTSILQDMHSEFNNAARLKSLDFVLESRIKDEVISGDSYTLTQMFQNVIDNAIKYTPKGKVEILVYNEEPEQITVEVRDTGIGIAAHFLPKMFSPFSQEETGYTRRFEGNGLGLALVKKYADLNKAIIRIDSKKGEGTSFKITFSMIN